MEERRLDRRIFESRPYEMALPTPRLMEVARAYRFILLGIQGGVVLLTLAWALANSGATSSDLLTYAALLTLAYAGLYAGRMLPYGNRLPGRQWWAAQLVVGFAEIAILAVLDKVYVQTPVDHASYWWALYILPIYRLAEVGGSIAWIMSLLMAISSIAAVDVFVTLRGGELQVVSLLGRASILALSTFIPYYIFRALDLGRQAARFWYPIAYRFIAHTADLVKNRELLRSVFEKGMDALVAADRGTLWQLDSRVCHGGSLQPVLKLVYSYGREDSSLSLWRKWILGRKPGAVTSQELLVPADVLLRELSDRHLEGFILESSQEEADPRAVPWLVKNEPGVNSWLVVCVTTGTHNPPKRFLEIGFRWRLRPYEWSAVKSRAIAVAQALGEVCESVREVEARNLKERLAVLEHEAEDEAELYRLAVDAMSGYYCRPVVLMQYSFVTGKIQTVVGDLEPEKVEWLQAWLNTRGSDAYHAGETHVCRATEGAQGEPPMQECYLFCPLISRGSTVEMVVLVDHTDQFTGSDHQVLKDSVVAINAVVTRWRAANLWRPDSITGVGAIATRGELHKLAKKIKEDTAADLVVLYEFEEGRPKSPPIMEGDLLRPEYYSQVKPVVIEEPNPILKVARSDRPLFLEDVQSHQLGMGLNRHGHPVFAVREAIASSIGLPLRTERGVIGVVWINFRCLQRFDARARQYYYELFRQLPRQLASVQLLETAHAVAEQNIRDRLQAELHDHVLQDLLVLGGDLETIRVSVQENQADKAFDYISKALLGLDGAEMRMRTVLHELDELTRGSDLAQRLGEMVRELQATYELPEEFKTDGLGQIPAHLYWDLYSVIREATINAVKHGRAKAIVVQTSNTENVLQVVIKDNGLGFDPRGEYSGYGIRTMHTRVRRMGGSIMIGSRIGEGTGVVLEVPLDQGEGFSHDGSH